jgi:hypothetical protein
MAAIVDKVFSFLISLENTGPDKKRGGCLVGILWADGLARFNFWRFAQS